MHIAMAFTHRDTFINIKRDAHRPNVDQVQFLYCCHIQDEFCRDVLSKFHLDAVGKLCQSDEVVIAVGQHLYRRSKQGRAKKPDIHGSCMRDMRRLASLTTAFKDAALRDKKVLSSEDILHRTHFDYLESAVEELRRRSDANSELNQGQNWPWDTC